jgi:hypothetical protein
VGDQFDVAVAIDFFVKRGKEGEEIKALDDVLRAGLEPGFMECGGGLEMAGPGGNGGEENAH